MPDFQQMKKNEKITGTVTGYTFDGAGVVMDENMPFFVPGLIEGEEAEIGITAIRKGYGYGRLLKVRKASEHRVTPGCPICMKCGGCQLLHMDAAEQARFKEDKVRHCFLQNAGMEVEVRPILTAGSDTAYRNKVQVPVQVVQGQVKMGFYRPRSNDIVEFERCLVQSDLSNQLVRDFRSWLQQLHCGKEFRHIMIRHARHTGQLMVVWIVRHYPFEHCQELTLRLLQKYPQVTSLTAIENRRSDNVILDGKETLIAGEPVIEESLLGRTFRISPRSFFQINADAAEVLYQTAIDYAGLTGRETLIDLYCGTGTIGILAADKARQVYGIEVVEDAIRDARVNAERNGVRNIEFIAADASEGAEKLLARQLQPDVVLVDPPRKGCSRATLDAIEKMHPQRMVYVSCDPATLARDCACMQEKNYRVQIVQPVDMFPGTQHVETVVMMSRAE